MNFWAEDESCILRPSFLPFCPTRFSEWDFCFDRMRGRRVGDDAPDSSFWGFDGMCGVHEGRFTNRPTEYIAPTGMGSFVNDPYKITRGGIRIQRWAGALDSSFWGFDGMCGVHEGRFTNRPKTNTIAPTGMGSFVNDPYKITRGGIGIQRWSVEDAGPYTALCAPPRGCGETCDEQIHGKSPKNIEKRRRVWYTVLRI